MDARTKLGLNIATFGISISNAAKDNVFISIFGLALICASAMEIATELHRLVKGTKP